MKNSVPKFILSHKRADIISTHEIINNCIVVIPESQLEEYKAAHPDLEYLTHPDSVLGLSPKRQWLYEKHGDMYQLDDDIMAVNRIYIEDNKERAYGLTPDEATDLLDDVFNIAKAEGHFLCGLNRRNAPAGYHGSQPIAMAGFVTAGAFGIMAGSRISFPDYPHFVGEDYYLNAINAYYHRTAYIEQRFSVHFRDTEMGVGGVSDYRTEKKRHEAYIYLKKYFGDSIVPKRPTPLKKKLMKWEKRLNIPWS